MKPHLAAAERYIALRVFLTQLVQQPVNNIYFQGPGGDDLTTLHCGRVLIANRQAMQHG
jgi:hypothetical protein